MAADKIKFKQIADEVTLERIDDVLASMRAKLLAGDQGGAETDLAALFNDLRSLRRAVEAADKKA